MPGRFLLLTLFLLTGCATTLQIPRPAFQGAERPPVHDGYSMIALPVTVRLAAVQDLINSRVPTVFHGSGHLDIPVSLLNTRVGVNYDYAFQRGPVSFTVVGNAIHATVKFSGTLHGQSTDLSLFQAQVGIDGDVRVDGPVTLQDDWTLLSRLNVTATVAHAELPVGFTVMGQRIGTSISIRQDMQNALDGAKRAISDAVNDAIRNIRLRDALLPYWRALPAPLALSKRPDVWLSVRPVAIAFSGLSGDGTTLRLGLGTVAQIACFVGSRPPDTPLGSLPNLTKTGQWGAFHVWLPVSVEYAELGRALSAELAQHPFELTQNSTKLTILQVQLWSHAGLLFVGVKVAAKNPDIAGWVYLQGRLQFDGGVPSVRDLDFTLDTKNGLVQAADGLLHSTLASWLGDSVNSVLAAHAGPDAADGLTKQLNTALQGVRLADGVTLRVNVDAAHVVGAYGSDAALELDTQFDGAASVSVNALAF
jgi:hypothetical protein